MRVIVTGCRDWMWPQLVDHELNHLYGDCDPADVLIIVHGDCPTGVDRFAKEWVERQRARHLKEKFKDQRPPEHEPYPYKRGLGRRGGPARNQEMAEDGGELCLAFWDGISTGTLNMLTEATLANIPSRTVPAPSPIPRTRRNT